ncbi:MAG: hypothetical protein SPL13_02710 [Clostridia bacterium]|nr:hypothetical protein [Clostridia bacterium]
MSKPLKEPDYTRWIIDKKSIDMDIPNRATPFCIVNTPTRFDEYEMGDYLHKLGIMGYAFDFSKDIFAKKYNLAELETLSVKEFKEKYTTENKEKYYELSYLAHIRIRN